MDLFQEKRGAPHQLMVVDTFSKRMAHEPLESNQAPDIVNGFKTAFKEMGGNPKSIYSDAEGGIVANTTKKWLKKEEIVSNIKELQRKSCPKIHRHDAFGGVQTRKQRRGEDAIGTEAEEQKSTA